LFALSERDLIVQQVSGNISNILGLPPESVLGGSFEAVMGAQHFEAFQTQLLSDAGFSATPLRVPATGGAVEMQCIAHCHDGVLIVELEPLEGARSLVPLDFDAHIRTPLSRMRVASDITELSRVTACEVRRLSGFDRVMVYRFDKEWNGEVNMPNMDGIQLITAIRKLSQYSFVPILMLSTESQAEKKDAGRKAGATGWIVKPFNADQTRHVRT
jgi:light-regulated signal transduction histidine kinase (bacteriophytochrome)